MRIKKPDVHGGRSFEHCEMMEAEERLSTTSRELAPASTVRASMLPFEQLPNLPKPVIPTIDLGIKRTDLLAIE